MMYGQMTAGSWIYIGSQGIVQGTYETFVEMGRQHYGGDLAGRWILTAGLGGMGGAQPLAATMAGASCLAVECQPSAHRHAPAHRLPRRAGATTSTRRSRSIESAPRAARPLSVGLLGNAADVFPELVRARRPARRRHRPDLRARSGERLPAARLDGGAVGRARARAIPQARRDGGASASMAVQVRGDARLSQDAGVPTFDYGNNIRQMAQGGRRRATRSTSRASCRPTSARCSAAASGRSAGWRCRAIRKTSTRPTRR